MFNKNHNTILFTHEQFHKKYYIIEYTKHVIKYEDTKFMAYMKHGFFSQIMHKEGKIVEVPKYIKTLEHQELGEVTNLNLD